ncbi:hypothetical protein BIV60_00265 [Bacillus sp. MUM 116]|uniref:hypothetical protein n=1 Tax=Bacillus sp. MUM 116 TaxID=1678002 RepID=UPI0008F56EF2|nr:hypothetical protein [Bacillus sp. MUM 116]OIK17165.1 hypothetical protein BIV60_00265 [Bacillus sp. MUM 116]
MNNTCVIVRIELILKNVFEIAFPNFVNVLLFVNVTRILYAFENVLVNNLSVLQDVDLVRDLKTNPAGAE